MAPVDPTRDPLPTARVAIDGDGAIVHEDTVFLARALVHEYEKIDQLYAALDNVSAETRTIVEQVLRETASWTPSTAACRDLRSAFRAAFGRGPGHAIDHDQLRLDWLSAREDRLLDVRGRINNESVSLREAIDWLMRAEAQESSTCA